MAGEGVFQLGDAADIAGVQIGDGNLRLAERAGDVGEAFVGAGGGVDQMGVVFEDAADDAEVGEAAGERVGEGFEDKDGRGKYLYGIYCTPCHGENGGNDGQVFGPGRLGKPVWKNYQDEYIKNLPIGQIYHVITYGKNNMGSHASVLTPMDRWRVIKYVKELSGTGASSATTSTPDSTALSTANQTK